jgi:5-methylcytosine-specific restriction protein A
MPSRPPIFHSSGKSREQREAERKAFLDAKRPSAAQRGYDADWRRCRALFIKANPVCCTPGCGQPSVEADHILSVRERPDLRLSWSNLRPLCTSCHSRRTASEQAFGRAKRAGGRG